MRTLFQELENCPYIPGQAYKYVGTGRPVFEGLHIFIRATFVPYDGITKYSFQALQEGGNTIDVRSDDVEEGDFEIVKPSNAENLPVFLKRRLSDLVDSRAPVRATAIIEIAKQIESAVLVLSWVKRVATYDYVQVLDSKGRRTSPRAQALTVLEEWVVNPKLPQTVVIEIKEFLIERSKRLKASQGKNTVPLP